ncbi:MAG: hypothetical protein E7461_02130 [Ruminococcaceae bacterium]|nr:hypothetical protein [Oscillospiraceae bacterium]
MRRTIVYKKQSIGVLNGIMMVVGLGMLIASFVLNGAVLDFLDKMQMFGAIAAIVGLVETIRYLLVPVSIIVLEDNNTLCLPKGIRIPLTDVYDVSYRRASARGLQYYWGSITLSTSQGRYKYDFVEDCESASKYLTKLVYDAKQKAVK